MEAIALEITTVEAKISAVAIGIEEKIKEIEEAKNAGLDRERELLREELIQLRGEKNELLKEKNKLRDREERLQLAGFTEAFRHPMLASGDSMSNVFDRLSRVTCNGENVGTIARIRADGLCASGAHVFVENGKFLSCYAFGSDRPLSLIGSIPYHDIIFIQGPPGPAFTIGNSPLLELGRKVWLVAHPLAPMRDLDVEKDPGAAPLVAQGRVTMLTTTLELAATDYNGAMPNSSGGPVLFDSRTLAGIHIGTTYHLDTSHHQEPPEEKPSRTRVDKDPNDMFDPIGKAAQGKRRAVASELVQKTEALALHSTANIRHKGQLALVVPASYMLNLAVDYLGMPAPELQNQPTTSRLGGRPRNLEGAAASSSTPSAIPTAKATPS